MLYTQTQNIQSNVDFRFSIKEFCCFFYKATKLKFKVYNTILYSKCITL